MEEEVLERNYGRPHLGWLKVKVAGGKVAMVGLRGSCPLLLH